ncbi:MAG: HlyD family efflux transporter periplasmic adaptor subunit, partial [Chthoniobacteraceae bacterium]
MHDFNTKTETPPALVGSRGWRVWRIVLPGIVLAGGVGIAFLFLSTSPTARSKPPGHAATLVEVAPVAFASRPATISAMGTVIPERSIDLHPQVNGEIVQVSENFVPGGIFTEGERMLRIDRTDYELAVQQISKTVAQAQTDLRMEQANQTIAKKDFEVLADVMAEGDRDMVLRKPQLDLAKASLEAATAELEKAKVDLIRTTVHAPFNAVVRSRQVNLGTRVTEATSLATLIGTDIYWVEIAVPVNQLRWIRIPKATGEEGSAVHIFNEAAWGPDVSRVGRVVRMAADLEEQGRMARLFVAVEDPMSLQPDHQDLPTMLIGSYVRAEIEG